MLPWQLDDIEVDTLSYWSQVIGIYRDERSKQEYYRDKEAAAEAKRRGGRRG